MKAAYLFLFVYGLGAICFAQDSNLSDEELKSTCKVLSSLTDKAVDNDRKDLIAIYYNTYQAIRLDHQITESCDQYFNDIRRIYFADIGNWTLGLDFPPKLSEETGSGGFTHKEVDTFRKIRAFGLTGDDVEQVVLLKELQKGAVDIDLIKTIDPKKLEIMSENLMKLKLNKSDLEKSKSLSDKQLQNEQSKSVTKQ